jgi:hypothetical protein
MNAVQLSKVLRIKPVSICLGALGSKSFDLILITQSNSIFLCKSKKAFSFSSLLLGNFMFISLIQRLI